MTDTLAGYRAVWKQKSVLRMLYGDIFERIADSVVDGPTLELGGGIGNLKEKIASLISSDIQFAPWLIWWQTRKSSRSQPVYFALVQGRRARVASRRPYRDGRTGNYIWQYALLSNSAP
jgi:hypothetical protein